MSNPLHLPRLVLIRAHSTPGERRQRLFLFVLWLALVGWLLSEHVFWRDEVRAFSLALSGADLGDMLRNIHGEGHPALWYLILRGSHNLIPVRQVLQAAAAVIGIAAMALFAVRAPFRTAIVAMVLFSLFGAFEYVVVARNYGISALVMFTLAASYPRVRNTPSFGLFLALLSNTNVPSCILAASFLLFRFVEMLSAEERPSARDWLMLGVNAGLALAGAILCFLTVYPPLNGDAVSTNVGAFSGSRLFHAVFNGRQGFSNLLMNLRGWVPPIVLWTSCLAFIRRPAAIAAASMALLALKLFFFFVYASAYRHEALFVVFLLSLQWMTAEAAGGCWRERRWMNSAEAVGTGAFMLLLAVQVLDLAKPLYLQAKGVPYSNSARIAQLLRQPGLSEAIVMADPDVMLEPLPYYVHNPLWFLREERFDRLFLRARSDRRQISLDTILSDADRLHRQSGKRIVFLSHLQLHDGEPERRLTMYDDATVLTPASVRRFRAKMRLIARLRPAITDETYDVYVYPR